VDLRSELRDDVSAARPLSLVQHAPPHKKTGHKGRLLYDRGDWRNLEREIQPYVLVFVNGQDPVLLRIAGMLCQSA